MQYCYYTAPHAQYSWGMMAAIELEARELCMKKCQQLIQLGQMQLVVRVLSRGCLFMKLEKRGENEAAGRYVNERLGFSR